MTIEGDSKEYELLAKWAKDFDCQGYKTCECTDPSCAEIVTTPCYALCYWIPGAADPCDPLVGIPLEDEKFFFVTSL